MATPTPSAKKSNTSPLRTPWVQVAWTISTRPPINHGINTPHKAICFLVALSRRPKVSSHTNSVRRPKRAKWVHLSIKLTPLSGVSGMG